MRITTLALVLLGLLAWSFDAKAADFGTGQDVLTHCKRFTEGARGSAISEVANATSCGWFVHGVVAGLDMGAAVAAEKVYGTLDTYERLMAFCTPDGVKMGQTVRVVVKYLENHPERLHEHVPLLINEALKEAFPCK